MTITPGATTGALPTSDPAVAAMHLDAARRGLDDAVASLRLAASQAGTSAAADACRAEISQLLGSLDAAAGTLDQAALVTGALVTRAVGP
jgi:hypothetical protein